MSHSSLVVFSFVVVVNLSLTGANNRIQQSSYNYKPSPYEDVVTNIGNGVGRKQVFVISDDPANGANTQVYRYPRLENRFGDPAPAPPRRTVNNYGNGSHNRNTYNLVSSGRTRPTQGSGSGYSGGTSFLAGTSTFNVGYGENNHNFINGKPVPAPAMNNGGRHQQQNFPNGVPNFASRSATVNNIGIGKNNHNTINFNDGPNHPVSGNGDRRNSQPQGSIDQATVNGVPIQPDHISATGFRTYHVPGQTVSVLNNSEGSRPLTNFDIQQLAEIRALSSQLQQISAQISQKARQNIQLR